MFRIATWNVNSLRVRLDHILQWLEQVQPDVLALQETKLPDDKFPVEELQEAGYESAFTGQKTYNGVATLSRKKAKNVIKGMPGYEDDQQRVLLTDIGNITVLNLYVPNGSEVGSEKYSYKLDWLEHLVGVIRDLLAKNPKLIVLGDFNIAPDNRDVHDPVEWTGSVLVSEPERDKFNKIREAGLEDCFRLFEQANDRFTWWDYRAAAFRRNRGLRIDHILASRALAGQCRSCFIDIEPRTLERPSDHTPVVAEFTL